SPVASRSRPRSRDWRRPWRARRRARPRPAPPPRDESCDALVARRHLARQVRAATVARREAELTRREQSLLDAQAAIARSNALSQMAAARREAQAVPLGLPQGPQSQPFHDDSVLQPG